MLSSKRKNICLSGLDGAGKTFIAGSLIEIIKKKYDVKHVWSRYKNYTSKPLLFITRLTGHNYKKSINGLEIGYHDFQNNKFISILFLFFQWIDQFIEIIFRFRLSKTSIVSDRSLIDTLIDLSVDTNLQKFIFGFYAKSLFSLMPKNTIYILIKRNIDLVEKVRPDVFYDKNRNVREELYAEISKIYPIYIVENNNDSEETLKRIFDIIDKSEKNC
tara:strand:+ start:704 stop:1354 length:651 start_codon:yes stop_codon:yes gene_type:complete